MKCQESRAIFDGSGYVRKRSALFEKILLGTENIASVTLEVASTEREYALPDGHYPVTGYGRGIESGCLPGKIHPCVCCGVKAMKIVHCTR